MKWLNRGGDGPQAIAFFAVLVVFTFAPLTSNAASGTLENWWCSTTDFFGLPLCEQAPLVAVEASLPQAAEISDPVAVVAHTTVVEKFNTHVIEPASVITEGLVLGISNFVSLDSFRRQADAALGSAAKSARSVGSDMQAAQDGIKEQVTTVARTVSGTVNGAGTLVAGSLSASTPLASGAVSGTLGHWWCTATDFLGLSLCGEAPSLVVVVPQSQPVQTPAPEPSAVHTTVVEQHNTYVTKPTTIVRETSGRANSEVVSPDSFHRQVDVVFDNVADSLRGVRDDIQAVRTDIAESVITAVLEVSGNANVGGNLDVTGTLTAGSLSVSSVSSGGVVEAPYFTATSSTASTLPYASTTAITVSGTASTTNLIANNFTLGSLTGFLKATAGVIATSLINLASDVTGVLAAVNGGTGLSTITNNQLLIGGAGNTFTQIATSSLGLITTDVAEGSNLYYTTTRFDNRLSATTTLPNLTTLANLTTVSTGLTGILKATSGALSAVSTLVPGDISLTKGNFLVGNDAGVAQATSSIFISSTGNVGIGSTVPDALLDIVGTTASLKSLLRVEQYATAVGAYGLEIHTYADNGAAPTPGAGAQSGLVIHNYTDAAPAMIIDQTRSTPLLLLRNSANPLTSSGTKGTGSFLDFAGYGLTDPNTLTDLGQISNHLSFSSYDPLVKWTFATGLDVNAGLRASITTAGAPDTTGTSETNNILRLLSGSTAVSMDMGVNNSPAYSWLQSRARTNYATNYSLVLNPNGGNVGVGTTSPASTLGVQGNGLFSGNLAVAGLTATGTVTFSGLSTGIAHLSSTGVLSSSAVALGGSDVTGTLTVANGGTGATTLTGLLQGNGTSAITAVTGTAGQFPYYNGTNTLLATSTLFVSTASNVGIGLTSPSARLNVKSAAANNLGGFMLTASGSSNYPVLIFENSSNGGQIELRDGSNVLATRITTNADSYITGGNVGIGTTSPNSTLSVRGTGNASTVVNTGAVQIGVRSASSNAGVELGVATVGATNYSMIQGFAFSTGAAQPLTVNPFGGNTLLNPTSGFVGIGTTTPNWQLQIAAATPKIVLSDTGASADNKHWFMQSSAGTFKIGTTSDAYTDGGVSALAINRSGFVAVGGASNSNNFNVSAQGSTNASFEVNIGSAVTVQSYNRNTSAYASMNYDASAVAFRTNATNGNLHTFRQLTTTLTGATVGGSFDYSTSVTNTANNMTGILLSTAAVTAASSNTLKGISLAPGAVTNAAGATTYTGLDLQMPAITQSAGTLTSTGIKIAGGTVTSGTSYALVTDSAAGNVGIGVTNPASKLTVHVATDANFHVGTDGTELIFGAYNDAVSAYAPMQMYASEFNLMSGNVGIGTTTPTQLLHVYGSTPFINITPSSTGQLSGVRLTDSANSGKGGFYYDATNDLLRFARSISTSATNGLAIDSSGNVGIGTIAPQWQQEISGTGQNTSAITDSGDKTGALLLRSRNNGVDSGGALIFAGNNTAGAYFGAIKGLLADGTSQTLGSIAFSTRNGTSDTALTERMRVHYNGNVGIGNVSPGYKLTVTDTTADGIAGRFDQSATSGSPFGIYSTATGAATQNIAGYFSASGATANLGVFINAPTASANNYALYSAATAQSYFAGNVGIGSTNPGWKLTIATAAATPVRSLDISGSTTGFNYASMSNTSGSLWWGVEGSSAGQVFASSLAYASVIGSSNATALQLASNGTVRMTLDTSGNVGIGTTSPQDKLHVYDGTAAVGNAGIRAEGYVGGYGAGIEAGSQLIGGSYLAMGKAVWDGESSWNSTVSTQDSYFSLHTTENGTLGEKLRVTSSGNVGIGTASPTNKLHVYSTTGQTSHFGGQGLGVTSTNFTGISFGYGETGPTYQKSALVQEQVGDGAARGTIHILNDGTNDSSNATLADARLSITYAGNVGIGTTTPATKLDVNGGGRFLDYTIPGSGTGLEIAYDPSIPAGRIIAIDRTTSTFKPLRLQASSIILNGGSEGNVGIGTTNPSTKFVVSGGANGFEFVPGATASDSVFQVYDRVASSYGTMDVDVAKLNVRINGSGSALYVDGSGNVGIGTTNPSAPFEVSRILTNADWTAVKISNNGAWGTASGKYAQMLFTDGTNNVAGIGATYDGTYGRLDFNALYNAGSGSTAAVAMSIRGNGNVGIGATNPLAKLDVASGAIFLSNSYYAGALPAVSVTPLTGEIRGGENAASSYGFLRLSAGSTVGEQSAIDIVGYNSLATDAQLIRLITSGNERMRVTQSGNVGIGTTTPIVRLSIANNSADGLSITNTSQTANNKIFAIQNTGSTLRIAPLNDAGSATADGLQIDRSGNVGIGTTSPESKLTVTGAVSASGLITSYGTGESFRAGNGGVGPVSLRAVNTGNDVYFGSEGSTAGGFFTGSLAYSSVIYSNTAIQQIIGGTSRMIINTAGNVGIGTASPSYKLDVNGFVNTQGTYTVGGYKLNGYSVLADASGDILVGDIGNNYAGGVSIRTAGSERVYVKNTGNVGIGDTSPDAKLDILQSSDASTQGLQISRSNDSDYMRLYMSAGVGTLSDTLIFSSAFGGDVAAIGRDGSAYFAGNVGIGNANPQYKLDVHSGATAEAVNFYSTDTTVYNPAVFQGTSRLNLVSGGGVTGSHSLIRFSNAAGSVENFFGVVQESNTRGAFVWKGYNGTTAAYGEYMRIANDGNVGIGTASPGQKLDVAGTVRQTGGVNCALSSNASGDIICTSDANLKENIAPFADGLSIIKGIDPSYFQYKGENYTHVGFIAQNVKAVLPAAAPLQNNGFLGLDSNAILAAVVNAIKELSNHLDGLQATVLGFSDRFTTKTLCVGETCVTEDELKMLLQNANINVAASAASSVPEETTQATTTPEIIEVGTSATSTEATSTEATSTEATSTPSVEVPPVPVVLVQEDEVGQIHMSETTFTSTLPSNEVPTSQYISL